MAKVTIHAAKTNLSRLIARVEAGEEVVICRGDKEVARLVPTHPTSEAGERPGRGSWQAHVHFMPGWNAPLDPEWLGLGADGDVK